MRRFGPCRPFMNTLSSVRPLGRRRCNAVRIAMNRVVKLHSLAGAPAARPRPLEIVSDNDWFLWVFKSTTGNTFHAFLDYSVTLVPLVT